MHKRKTKNQSESRLSGVVCILNTRKDRSPKDSQKKHTIRTVAVIWGLGFYKTLFSFLSTREKERDGRGGERLAFD